MFEILGFLLTILTPTLILEIFFFFFVKSILSSGFIFFFKLNTLILVGDY